MPSPLDELRARVADGSVRTVLLALPDMQGRLKGKRYPAGFFLDQLAGKSAEVCGYVLATDVDMRPLEGYDLASWSSGYADLLLVPDPSTVRLLPGDDGCALVLGDVRDQEGLPVEVAPREVLRRQLDGLAALGLTARIGLETEFTVYRGTREADGAVPVPVSAHNLDYALSHSRPLAGYLRGLEESLAGSGLPLEAVKTEAASGQVEVTFRYGEPMAAADGHVLFKHLAREVAHGHGLTPTFMAAPVTGVGNGLHVHLSLWRDGKPLFPGGAGNRAATSGPAGMSALAGQAVAGLVDTVPQLMPLMLPQVNSYKRLVAGSFAPTRMTWGPDNRTCAVRVAGHGSGLHLELRVAGADANPYLLAAAALAACRYGIEQGLKPSAPLTGNAYEAVEAPLIPSGPSAGLGAFRESRVARELLGERVVRHYARAAEIEIDALAMEVTDAERRRGMTRA